MKKMLLLAILAASTITFPPIQAKVCNFCASDDFNKLITDNAKVVVDFYAPWCGPCKAMKPTFEALGKTTEMDNVLFITVNTDSFASLASKYGVQGIPHLKIFKDGKVVATSVGAKSASALKSWVNSYLK